MGRVLVTGANGQLGNEMRIIAKGREEKFLFTDVCEQDGVETLFLDITDMEAVRRVVKEQNIGVIVNCAAYTNVDGAETDPSLAEELNAAAPENLAKAMKEACDYFEEAEVEHIVRAMEKLSFGRGNVGKEAMKKVVNAVTIVHKRSYEELVWWKKVLYRFVWHLY